jgi:hypothetical protein
MEKVRVYDIGKAVEKSNEGKKEVVGFDKFAIIVKDNTAVIIESDACHCIKDLPETFKIGITEKKEGTIAISPESFIYPTVEWILKNVEYEEVELPKWIMYFNIKNRIIGNCNMLRDTLEDIGLNPENYLGKQN